VNSEILLSLIHKKVIFYLKISNFSSIEYNFFILKVYVINKVLMKLNAR